MTDLQAENDTLKCSTVTLEGTQYRITCKKCGHWNYALIDARKYAVAEARDHERLMHPSLWRRFMDRRIPPGEPVA